MFNYTLFFLILFIFLILILVQVYFYSYKYVKNQEHIQKIESFSNTLTSLNKSNNEFILDDSSMEKLLEDYNKLKY
jgi:cell division protein FtsL